MAVLGTLVERRDSMKRIICWLVGHVWKMEASCPTEYCRRCRVLRKLTGTRLEEWDRLSATDPHMAHHGLLP